MKMKSAALSLAAFVFVVVLPVQSHAETYYLAGTDTAGNSALAGYGSVGWKTADGTVYKDHVPSAGNRYSIGSGLIARTPETGDFVFAGDALELQDGAQIGMKIPDEHSVTFADCLVLGNVLLTEWVDNAAHWIDGRYAISDGAELFLSVNGPNLRIFRLRGEVCGTGRLKIGNGSTAGSYVRVTSLLKDFAGQLEVCSAGATKACLVQDLPAEPNEPVADSLILDAGAGLSIEGTVVRGVNFGVTLKGSATLDVPAGYAVRLNGPLTGSLTLTKTGAGELVLANASPDFTGEVVVSAGKLSYALQNATVTTSGSGVAQQIGTSSDIYVSTNGSSVPPYATSETAARALADALSVASFGSVVHVAAGEYAQSAAVSVPAGLVIEGPADRSAVITGNGIALSGAGARVAGLTFRECASPAISSVAGSVVSNCTISGSNALSLGGVLTDSSVTDFVGVYGVRLVGAGPIEIRRSRMSEGKISQMSNYRSGAIFDDSTCMRIPIDDCVFSNIQNTCGSDASAVLACKKNLYHNFILNRCQVLGNSARCAFSRGGSDGINENHAYVTNCLFAANSSTMMLAWISGEFVNCTFADNLGVQSLAADPVVKVCNCVISDNASGTFSGSGSPVVSYTLLPEASTIGGDGNVPGPAVFLKKGVHPYMLKRSSPGVDAGAPLNWGRKDLDLAGNRRLSGAAVDMGCYELPSSGMVLTVE